MTQSLPLTVLYNERCPICRAEIAHYRSYCEGRDLPVAFEDLNNTDLTQWGVTEEDAARRLHARRGDDFLSGLAAFEALWALMPRYRWIARGLRIPGLRPVADFGYNKVLAPWLYRRHLRREARQAEMSAR